MTPLVASVPIGVGPTGHKFWCSLVNISQLSRSPGALSSLLSLISSLVIVLSLKKIAVFSAGCLGHLLLWSWGTPTVAGGGAVREARGFREFSDFVQSFWERPRFVLLVHSGVQAGTWCGAQSCGRGRKGVVIRSQGKSKGVLLFGRAWARGLPLPHQSRRRSGRQSLAREDVQVP